MSNPFAKYLEAVQRQDALFGTKLSRQSASVYDDYTPPEDTIKPTKTLDNYIGDTAVDVVKAGITAQQVATSAVDLALYAAGGYLSAGQLIGNKIAPNLIDAPVSYEYGMGTKQLKEGLGIDLNDAKKYWGDKYYSDIRKAQEQELHTGYTQEQIDAFNNQWANQYNLQYQD
ncbi:MAG: hypothetical protein KDH96_10120, partial [Candidatus Riesia sp.]|nr:hypothetical protein [Candidatus Riesia sp.]